MKGTIRKYIREFFGFLLIKWFYLSGNKEEKILSVTLHNPSLVQFKDIVTWLRRRGYSIVSLEDFERVVETKQSSGKIAIITLDDGWRSNLELLDFIESEKVPIGLFIPVEPVISGNYWWEYAKIPGQQKFTRISQVKEFKEIPFKEFAEKISVLKENYSLVRSCIDRAQLNRVASCNLITIGSHTVTHPLLNQCDVEYQAYEISDSRKVLEGWLGRTVDYFAYPNGNFNKETVGIVKESGYRMAFTVDYSPIDLEMVNRFLIPRKPLSENAGIYENIAKMLGIWFRITGNDLSDTNVKY